MGKPFCSYCNSRDSSNSHCPVCQRTNRYLQQIEQLQQQLEAVRPYLQHRVDCRLGWKADAPKTDCNCGLEAAIKGEGDE